jgi:hypothetical protein
MPFRMGFNAGVIKYVIRQLENQSPHLAANLQKTPHIATTPISLTKSTKRSPENVEFVLHNLSLITLFVLSPPSVTPWRPPLSVALCS